MPAPRSHPSKSKPNSSAEIVELVELSGYRLFRMGVFFYGLYELWIREIHR
jgi:hypothetical protein